MSANYLIVGAGFSGATLARCLAADAGNCIQVIDARDHLGGNCHTRRDAQSNVMIHTYGPHIFHTDHPRVWQFVNRFGEFRPFVNRMKASIERGVFTLPVNLHTINQFFGKRFSPDEARGFLESLGDPSIGEPQNFEQQALKFLGRELYEAFFYGYTKKQWGCEPSELPASILKRLPIRFNYDDNYYFSSFQGIPVDGYTEVIRKMLEHPQIEVTLSTSYLPEMRDHFDHIFYTGPLDAYFGHSLGLLGYRTVFWNRETHAGDFQGAAIVTYPGMDVPYTRIHEHKHFTPWENHALTEVFTEFSKETTLRDVPYYPKRLAADMTRFSAYQDLARAEPKVSFLGRLATYRYMDMDQVIAEAMLLADACHASNAAKQPISTFPPIPSARLLSEDCEEMPPS